NKLLPEGVDLNLNLGRTEWSVGVDVGSLENSIINMVLNAKDAMPDGGNITIETEGVTLAEPLTGALVEVAAGDYVTISIKDDGTGMDAPTAERSLEPFFTTKLSGAGTGLGLSMVHRFVESSNAGLVLNTKLGEGTSFVIYLPRVQLEVEETTDSAMTVSGSKGEGQTILVVDDEPALLKLLVNILEPVGYNVVEAINAQDAIDMLDANPDIDAVITDVVMPGVLNGFDLALHAKETKPDMPVILLSGYSEQTLAQDARYERFVGCLVEKPIDYMELTKRLGQALLSKNQVCC
ncbi:MAG: response regulator, partial [Sphingomonadales bacterium]|nr:response regulator [Sphingomonadales bacterium]